MKTFETDQPLHDIAIAAVEVEAATSFPAAVTLAFWAVESQWGAAVTGAFNYWGIARLPEHGAAEMCATHEDITPAQLAGFDSRERATAVRGIALGSGRYRYAMKRYFATYGSLRESVAAFVGMFTNSPQRYVSAWSSYRDNGEADLLIKGICLAGYATDAASVSVRLAISHQSNVVHAIEAARAAVGAAASVSLT